MNATTEQPGAAAGLALTCPHCGSGAIVMVGGSEGAGVLACEDCGEVFALRRKMTPPPSDSGGAGGEDEAGGGEGDDEGAGGDSSGEGSGGAGAGASGGDDEDEAGGDLDEGDEAGAGDDDEAGPESPGGPSDQPPPSTPPAPSDGSITQEAPAWLKGGGDGQPPPSGRLPIALQCTSEEEVRLLFTGFTRRIGQVLKDNTFSRPQRGKRRGEINERSLYKGGIPQGSPRIFQQKENVGGRKYGFVICVDGSGSMHSYITPHIKIAERSWAGQGVYVLRSELAGYATQMITTGLIKNNIPVVALLGALTGPSGGVSYLYDGSTKHMERKILRKVMSRTGGSNTDYILAASAAIEVEKMRRADPDIHPIIVYIVDGGIGPFETRVVCRPVDVRGRPIISDGIYADASAGTLIKGKATNDYKGRTEPGLEVMSRYYIYDEVGDPRITQLHVLNDQLIKSGADVITIGINDNGLRAWYPNCAVVNSEAEFVAALTGGIKKAVRNHQKKIRS